MQEMQKTAPTARWCKLMADPRFWSKIKSIHALIKPFAEFIHKLEGDKPYLGQMSVIWSTLREHVKDWCKTTACPTELTPGVNSTFEEIFEFCYHPSMPAAYLLDPINWEVERDEEDNVVKVSMPLNPSRHERGGMQLRP